ncbi:site-specific integrase [Pseudomonas sp.]|uniref:site-specific integrase n=1 Tax=Pseudomonas sp. TaxID=306 RepID=UPI00260C6A16|nr:site-specific integrase [Pseudomonas sp.]
MANLTDKAMKAKPGHTHKWMSEVAIWGHGSLLARITPAGDRLFYFQYSSEAGKRYALPIGTYGPGDDAATMTLSDARQRAMELASLHKTGIKNIREHLESEEAARVATRDAKLAQLDAEKAAAASDLARHAARKSVTELFEHWAKIDLINRKDGGAEVRRMFEKDVLPLIGTVAVADVKKGHITEVTDAMLSRGVNRAAKIAFSLVRQMFRFGVDRDLIEHDPSAGIRKAKIGGRDVERDRVLNDDEIRLLYQKAPQAGLLITTEAAIWIALSSCCRIGELMSSKWEHIDFEQKTWLIPGENSKNGKPHVISLSGFLAEQFRRVQQINGKSTWCYPNTDNSGPVSSKTVTKQLGDRQRQPEQGTMSRRSAKAQALILPGGKWTPHDLRRTGATLMTALGVLPEVAERCLNHTEDNKMKRIYQRHSYAAEMAMAWKLLGERLEVLTTANLRLDATDSDIVS